MKSKGRWLGGKEKEGRKKERRRWGIRVKGKVREVKLVREDKRGEREREKRWKAQEELSGEGKDQWSPFVCCLASPLKACPERQ